MWHWILHITGADNVSGPWYGFWSGFGSDIAELGLLGMLWHRFNCHAKGCPRLGIHKVDGTTFVTCRKHHPLTDGKKTTAEQIDVIHKINLARNTGPSHVQTGTSNTKHGQWASAPKPKG